MPNSFLMLGVAFQVVDAMSAFIRKDAGDPDLDDFEMSDLAVAKSLNISIVLLALLAPHIAGTLTGKDGGQMGEVMNTRNPPTGPLGASISMISTAASTGTFLARQTFGGD
jgi:hypothetical protein